VPILAILAAIGTALATAGGYLIDSIKLVWEVVWQLLHGFWQNAPQVLRVFIFLFLVVSIGNLFSNFFLGSNYACTSENQLYKANNLFEGIGNRIRMTFFGWTISQSDTFITSNYNYLQQVADVTNIRCIDAEPRLYFYSVDVFSYNLWLLLLILLYGTPLAVKYYKAMGALH
jgi:hypothetical protein